MLGSQLTIPWHAALVLCALLVASLNTPLTSVTRLSRQVVSVLDLSYEGNVNQTSTLISPSPTLLCIVTSTTPAKQWYISGWKCPISLNPYPLWLSVLAVSGRVIETGRHPG